MIFSNTLSAFWLAAWLFAPIYCLADTGDAEQQQQKLEQIHEEIEHITQTLEKDLENRNQLQTKLRSVEKQLNKLNRTLNKLTKDIKRKEKKLQGLNREKAELNRQLGLQKKQLSSQILSAYKIGRQEQIKLILNQSDPGTLNRVLSYYRYINNARLALIDNIDQQMARVHELSNTIGNEVLELKALNDKKQASANALNKNRRQRQNVIDEINQQIQTYGTQITALKADEKRIKALIQSISGILNDIPDNLSSLPFMSLKGQLNWPTKGPLKHKFGEKRGDSDLMWQGIAIQAPSGQAVHAISHGRVVFSDWLQGFGLLLIIDHQDGFMSLYAHQEALYKETGDWVQQGETIGSVGSSGGLSKPRLYLEIRRQGTPINPEAWFKVKV